MGCPYPAPRWKKAVKKVLRELDQEAKILDLGSGLDRRTPNTINLEIEATPNVDVLGDGHKLPFKDAVFDAVISEAVLEHVQDPNRVVSEMHRVLKPGGTVCAAVPFLQGFHASPHDYQRYTVPGFDHLFSAFEREWRAARARDRRRRCTGSSGSMSGCCFPSGICCWLS